MRSIFLMATCACLFGFAAPMPSTQLLARIKNGPEVIAIVHWGPNTYLEREWGYGDASPAIVNPSKFNADQIASACKAGGIGGIVFVAKHHDGFCLWPTKTTEYNISKSPFRGGKGDCVKEMETACRRAGLKFGIYISPWDRNNADYGTPKYVETYHAQYRELCGGAYGEIFEAWFDGANGGDGYYGGARERRRIPNGYYRYDGLAKMLLELQPGITFMGIGDFSWPGNEAGVIRPNTSHSDASRFRMFEADFPLRRRWFYDARHKGMSKNGETLAKIYFTSVGRGGTMNIGIAPNKDGILDEEDCEKLRAFGQIKAELFANEIKDAGSRFNIVELREDLSCGEQVHEWSLVADGKTVAAGRFIGAKRLVTFLEPLAARALEISVPSDLRKFVSVKRYFAPPELLKKIGVADAAADTDTAKKMRAGAISN